jgi:Vacuolar protein sorting-associated protein 62
MTTKNINNDADILSVMKFWAPVVYFHPKEKCFPSSVEFFLDRVKLVDERSEKITILPPLTNEIMREYSDGTVKSNNKIYLDIPDDDDIAEYIKRGEPLYGEFIDYADSPTMMCQSPVYCHMLRIDSAICDLQYWMFYPNDDPVGWFDSKAGAHEGDWEHVSIRLNWPEAHPEERSLTDIMNKSAFHSIYGSAHSGEGSWNTKPVWVSCDDNQNHAAIFAAQGTHANYSTLGDNGTIHRTFSDDYVGDTGAYWLTYKNIVPIAWSDDLPDDLAWLGFNGRWGATQDKIGVSSPTGPAMKSQFTKGDPSSSNIVPKSS